MTIPVRSTLLTVLYHPKLPLEVSYFLGYNVNSLQGQKVSLNPNRYTGRCVIKGMLKQWIHFTLKQTYNLERSNVFQCFFIWMSSTTYGILEKNDATCPAAAIVLHLWPIFTASGRSGRVSWFEVTFIDLTKGRQPPELLGQYPVIKK